MKEDNNESMKATCKHVLTTAKMRKTATASVFPASPSQTPRTHQSELNRHRQCINSGIPITIRKLLRRTGIRA